MEDNKELTKKELAEMGKRGYKLEGVEPATFDSNVSTKLITSRKLAHEIAKFFFAMTEDVAGCIIDVNKLTNRVSCWLYLQNNKFDYEKNKFKAVLQSNQIARNSSIIDAYTNTYRAQNTLMSLTDDAKATFEEFLWVDAPRGQKQDGTKFPRWNQIYTEKTNNHDPYGINPAAVYNYGVVELDPTRILAKIYGEKASENAYFEYAIFINTIIGMQDVNYPNYLLSIMRANGETISKVASEVGFSMQNDLGFVTPFAP